MTTQTNEEKFKSVRLNQAHRNDIIEAVMKQWEIKNPRPQPDNEALLRSLFKRYANVGRGTAEEFKSIKYFLQDLVKVTEPLKLIDSDQLNRLAIPYTGRLTFRVQDARGQNKRDFTFDYVPAALAIELGLSVSHIDTVTSTIVSAKWPSHYTVDGAFEYAVFVSIAGGYKSTYLVIEHGIPELVKYDNQCKAAKLWDNEHDTVRSEVEDYLTMFNTTGQIREQWPEMVQYLPPHIADPERVIKLPALTKSRLNERLGL